MERSLSPGACLHISAKQATALLPSQKPCCHPAQLPQLSSLTMMPQNALMLTCGETDDFPAARLLQTLLLSTLGGLPHSRTIDGQASLAPLPSPCARSVGSSQASSACRIHCFMASFPHVGGPRGGHSGRVLPEPACLPPAKLMSQPACLAAAACTFLGCS